MKLTSHHLRQFQLIILLSCVAPLYSMTWGRAVDKGAKGGTAGSAKASTTPAYAAGGGAAAADEHSAIVAAVSAAVATNPLSNSTTLRRSYADATKAGLAPAAAGLYAVEAVSTSTTKAATDTASTASTTPAPSAALAGNAPLVSNTVASTAGPLASASATVIPTDSASTSAAKSAAAASTACPALDCGITAAPSVITKLWGYVWAVDPVLQMRAGSLTPEQVRIHDIENRLEASITASNTADVITIIDWLDQHPKFVLNRTYTERATNYLANSKALAVSQVAKALSTGETEIITAANVVMERCAATAQAHSVHAHQIKRAQTKARNLAKASGASAATVGDDADYSDDEAYDRPHAIPAAVKPETLLAQTFTDARTRYTFPTQRGSTSSDAR